MEEHPSRHINIDIDAKQQAPAAPGDIMFLEQVLDDQPQNVQCPHCNEQILTKVKSAPGDGSCWQMCCPDPDITTTYHSCPECKLPIGEVRRRYVSGASGREDEDQQFDFEVVVHGVQKKKLLAS